MLQHQYPQQPYQQPQQQQQPRQQALGVQFDPIPITYEQLFPALLRKNLVVTRPPPAILEKLPPWNKHDRFCSFHQGALAQSTKDCFGLQKVVQNLIRDKKINFTDLNPNFQTNPLPNHGVAPVNMIDDCRRTYRILDVQRIRTPLVPLHTKLCKMALFKHDHVTYEVCSINPWGCQKVKDDIQRLLNRGELVVERKCDDVCVITREEPSEILFDSRESATAPLVVCLPGPVPYVPSTVPGSFIPYLRPMPSLKTILKECHEAL